MIQGEKAHHYASACATLGGGGLARHMSDQKGVGRRGMSEGCEERKERGVCVRRGMREGCGKRCVRRGMREACEERCGRRERREACV